MTMKVPSVFSQVNYAIDVGLVNFACPRINIAACHSLNTPGILEYNQQVFKLQYSRVKYALPCSLQGVPGPIS